MLSALTQWLEHKNSRKNQKRWESIVQKVGSQEQELQNLSDEKLRERCMLVRSECKEQFISRWEGRVEQLSINAERDPMFIKTAALVRECSRRVLGLRQYDVQIMGGCALHEGMLAEMRTGEGKTLVITLPVIYNAYCGIQPHVITVNEYLATRDAGLMSKLYNFMGLTVGLLKEGQQTAERQEEYQKDIVYGVNHEFGFDYLRDNMVLSVSERRQRGLGYAVIDEVDSILIDEARTPLIITSQSNSHEQLYQVISKMVQILGPDDVEVEHKEHTVALTDLGFTKLEHMLLETGMIEKSHQLYDPLFQDIRFVLQACLQARYLYVKDQQYIIQDGKVVIVDEGTGRLMPDRRWGHGVHQAVEAKEGVAIEPETKTQGQITYQNFFRLYKKISGLTGTALTQKEEFAQMYGLHCEKIKTHRPMIRKDHTDIVYRSLEEKFEAIVELAAQEHKKGRPILIGTPTVEESERISVYLQKAGLAHQVLNAKNHSREAEIIANAGCLNALTVATNMAGRGTDILLGGNLEAQINELKEQIKDGYLKNIIAQWEDAQVDEALMGIQEQALRSLDWDQFCKLFDATEVFEKHANILKEQWKKDHDEVVRLGGLMVIGSSRHDSRRVDNQLRGRSGRQGDPGESQFILSLEDTLFTVYGQKGFVQMIDRMNLMPKGTSLQSEMIVKSLERAQSAVEAHHFNARKQLNDYDAVGAAQRKAIYGWRNEVLESTSNALRWAQDCIGWAVEELLGSLISENSFSTQWDKQAIQTVLSDSFSFEAHWVEDKIGDQAAEDMSSEEFLDSVVKQVESILAQRAESLGEGQWAHFVQRTLLERIDIHWQDHLDALSGLMESIHLRSFAQKDPKNEYKHDAYQMFKQMRSMIALSTTEALIGIELPSEFRVSMNEDLSVEQIEKMQELEEGR